MLTFKSLSEAWQKVAVGGVSLLAVLALAGCTTPEVCTTLGTCGGDVLAGQPSKTWNVASSCINDVAAPQPVPQLIHQAPTLAGEVPPKRSQVNWCSDMIIDKDKSIGSIQPWYPSLPLQSGLITFTQDGSYTGSINYFGIQEQDFAAGCFLTQGFKIKPDDGVASTADTMTCADFTAALKDGYATQPNILKDDVFNCGDDGAGGCTCVYNLLLITAVEGKYAPIGNVINFYDTVSHGQVSSADYCVNGNSLELSGYKRTFLFNQPALRSLTLTAD